MSGMLMAENLKFVGRNVILLSLYLYLMPASLILKNQVFPSDISLCVYEQKLRFALTITQIYKAEGLP